MSLDSTRQVRTQLNCFIHWTFSDDEERWEISPTRLFVTCEEAEAQGKYDCGTSFWTGRVVELTVDELGLSWMVDQLLERMEEGAFEIIGEASCDWVTEVMPEVKQKLYGYIEKAAKTAIEAAGPRYKIEEIRYYANTAPKYIGWESSGEIEQRSDESLGSQRPRDGVQDLPSAHS